jgi:hypothetical protein
MFLVTIAMLLAAPRLLHGAIHIYGHHECPDGTEWSGENCEDEGPQGGGGIWWPEPNEPNEPDENDTSGPIGGGGGGVVEPVCTAEPVADADTEWGPVCSQETICEECNTGAEKCANKAKAFAADVEKILKQQAFDRCNLNDPGRPPGQAEAKGGHSIDDLKAGLDVVGGMPQSAWTYSCTGIKCKGPAYDSCMKTYRADLPEFAAMKNMTGSVTIEPTYMGFSVGSSTFMEAQTVTYEYGGSTGYATTVNSLQQTIGIKCAEAKHACLGDVVCGGQ